MDFTSTVEAVEREARDHGFVIDRTHDLRATLASKGFDIHPLKIFEVSSATWRGTGGVGESFASQCRLHVYEEDGVVYVNAIRPTVLCRAIQDPVSERRIDRVEQAVVALVDAVVER